MDVASAEDERAEATIASILHGRDTCLGVLRDPLTGRALELDVSELRDDRVREGTLRVTDDRPAYPIRGYIPRFVGESDVVASFGEQWRRWRTTQLDSVNGSHASRDRLLTCSGWSPGELAGARVLDVGCGAGRFSEVLLALGANVTAVDASTAVEVCLENASNHERLCAVQADLHALPFERGSFDRVLCYGVLQHTPDPGRAFARLVPLLRPGGAIAIDVYLRSLWIHRWTAKYWYRPLTRRLPRDLVRAIVEWYVPRWIPIDRALARVPLFGHVAAALVPCPLVLSTLQGVAPEVQVGWAVLDTFDALTAWHDHPQTVVAVRSWFRKAGLENVDVRVGGNGIVGNGVMPEVAAA